MTTSDHLPNQVEYLQGGKIINWNIQNIEKIDEILNEIKIQYKYNSIRVELNFTRNEIINAMIRYKYSISDEFALINNYNNGSDLENYENYQNYRIECKNIVNSI
jgi:hypothetical protein